MKNLLRDVREHLPCQYSQPAQLFSVRSDVRDTLLRVESDPER